MRPNCMELDEFLDLFTNCLPGVVPRKRDVVGNYEDEIVMTNSSGVSFDNLSKRTLYDKPKKSWNNIGAFFKHCPFFPIPLYASR